LNGWVKTLQQVGKLAMSIVIPTIAHLYALAGDYGLLRSSAHGGFNIWLDAGSSL
jgi:hypothetical protein